MVMKSSYKLPKGFLIGCDPELFLYDTKKKEYVHASQYIPGTKEEPHPVIGGAIQSDGLAAEINIKPSISFTDFNGRIHAVLTQLKEYVPEYVEFHYDPSVVFSEEEWANTPDQDKVLGCTPDLNAWEMNMNPPPNTSDSPRLRTLGGHIHVGWTEDEDITNKDHLMNCVELVKQLDWFLGGWSLGVDRDSTRRSLYGKAGSCRIKHYGVEYRVLSSFWLSSEKLRQEVWNRTVDAINKMRVNYFPEKEGQMIKYNTSGLHYTYNELLIESINTSVRKRDLFSDVPYPLVNL